MEEASEGEVDKEYQIVIKLTGELEFKRMLSNEEDN